MGSTSPHNKTIQMDLQAGLHHEHAWASACPLALPLALPDHLLVSVLPVRRMWVQKPPRALVWLGLPACRASRPRWRQ